MDPTIHSALAKPQPSTVVATCSPASASSTPDRTLVLAKADLKQLQQERVEAEEGMASCAALIRPSRPIALNGCC